MVSNPASAMPEITSSKAFPDPTHDSPDYQQHHGQRNGQSRLPVQVNPKTLDSCQEVTDQASLMLRRR
jgi:hypothetical protein